MTYNECKSCVERSCKECLIQRIHSIPKEHLVIKSKIISLPEEDFSVALTSR